LGIGDWGLGIGDWAQSPIPNPHSISKINKLIKNVFNQKEIIYNITDNKKINLINFN